MTTEIANYEGKFVFIERIDSSKSTYGNGEYFCVRQTPASLYCVKTLEGYGGHNLEIKSLIGSEAHRVVESWEDDETARRFAVAQMAWGELIKDPNHKKQWIESVYSGAVDVARQTLRCLEKKRGVSIQIAPQTDTLEVCVPKGISKIMLKFQNAQ